MHENRKCKKCGEVKVIDQFESITSSSGNICHRWKCKTCIKDNRKNYRNINKIKQQRSTPEYKIKKSKWDRNYRQQNKEKLAAKRSSYYLKNKDSILEKRKIYTSCEIYKRNRRENQKLKKQLDPGFRLESIIKSKISTALKREVKSFIAESYFKTLGYTRQELLTHLESQFESWMNWNNYGPYNSKLWNELDPTTWTWQIDHITPQSELKFYSVEDENFKKCWGLYNLRPYSAKLNIIDGAKKSRHKK